MALLDQLQSDHAKITEILKAHCEAQQVSSQNSSIPIDMLRKVYIDSLEDALKTLSSLIDYLKQS
jgi:hypothetical protein